jgi:hypothetical protein
VDEAAVRQQLAERLKGIAYDVERTCGVAFANGQIQLAGDLNEATAMLERVIELTEATAAHQG